MKKIARNICVILCIIIIFSSFTSVHGIDSIIADSEAGLVDEKIYSNATIDQDFA